MNNRNWKDEIGGMFGCEDCKFALHPFDIARAKEVLKKVLDSGVSYDEYVREIETYLKKRNCSDSHIEEQMNRVKSIGSYFEQ